MNIVTLRGVISEPAVFSHESRGNVYYKLFLTTTRLSGTEDTVRVLMHEPLLKTYDPEVGASVEIEGTMRSFNNKTGEGNRLYLSVLAKSITVTDLPAENRVELSGALCKEPIYRRTPLGREICDMMLAVPRLYGKADYLPIIAWGSQARIASELKIGDRVSIDGRFQSRQYIKVIDDVSYEKVAYEISATRIIPEIIPNA